MSKITKKKGKKIRLKPVLDFTTLTIGSTIKCSMGPYYQQDGKKVYLGYNGVCHVRAIKPDGLVCIDSSNGTVFIYMGPTRPGIVGTKQAHKIKEMIYD